jgi:hypothetical protein
MALTPDPRSAGVIPSTKGSLESPVIFVTPWPDDRRRRRLRHGQPALGVAGGDARGRGHGVEVIVTHDPEEVRAAERVVLPGQGAMRDCMRELRDSGLKDAVLRRRRQQAADGRVRGHADAARPQRRAGHARPGPDPRRGAALPAGGRLQPDGSRYKVPQMGWNRVAPGHGAPAPDVGRVCPTAAYFYFVHSYYAEPSDPRHSAGRNRLRRRALPARWRGITFLPPSSTPRRAPTTAWPCTATSSLAWKP